MYISVIPLRHSLSRYPYTYFVGEDWREDISPGYLVEIPLGKNMIEGIVAAIDIPIPETLESSDIRAIIRVIAGVEIIAQYTIEMILWIAEKYFLPIHKVASMFLPAPLLTKLDKKNYILEKNLEENPPPWISRIHHYIDSIFCPEDISRYLIPGSVLIFPDDILLSLFAKSIPESIMPHVAHVPTDLTSTKRVSAWIDAYMKKYSIIFWTRRILYYNLSAYSHIVYIEDTFGTEQYQYPIKIQNLDILKALENTNKHSITIVSSSPGLMTLAYFRHFGIEPIRSWETI